MKRIVGPSNDYDFSEKQRYREDIWSNVKEHLKVHPSKAKVIFFPSKHGFEIPLILKKGFKEENLYAVERDKDVVKFAFSDGWKKQYPNIKYYHKEATEFIELASEKIKFDVVILDICNNFSIHLIKEMTNIFEQPFFNDGCIFSTTLIHGRENGEMAALVRIFSKERYDKAIDRMGLLMSYISNLFCIRYDVIKPNSLYRSGGGNMCYGIYQLKN